MKKTTLLAVVSVLTISCLATLAHAADNAAPGDDDSLTKYGITLYGTIDLGVVYQTHGAPISGEFHATYESLISKNSNNSIFGIEGNGMSQSKIGLKGTEELMDGLAGIFKLETGFNPNSGAISDSVKSVAENNGQPLTSQTSNADSSRAGQVFNGAAYAGLDSKTYGTLTFGRQNAIMLDDVIKYDPNGASNAFSVIGYSGTTAGMGDTEDARLDSSLKYALDMGPGHVDALYKMGGYGTSQNSAYEAQVGADLGGLSVDAIYNVVMDAIATSAATTYAGPANSIAATISDNTTYGLMAKYKLDAFKFYAGWERIEYANPEYAKTVGNTTIGGYVLGTVNNAAYNNNKMLNVIWTGVKYSLTPKIDVTGAYYHYDQNSFAGNGCTDTSSSSCSGSLNAVSLVFTETLTKHFDLYQGAMYSSVSNGMASGYLYTNTIDPAVGARLNF